MNTNEKKPFIHISGTNEITIEGGIIFHRCPLVCEGSPMAVKIFDNEFYMSRPHWWQLVQWFRIVRTIHAALPPHSEAVFK